MERGSRLRANLLAWFPLAFHFGITGCSGNTRPRATNRPSNGFNPRHAPPAGVRPWRWSQVGYQMPNRPRSGPASTLVAASDAGPNRALGAVEAWHVLYRSVPAHRDGTALVSGMVLPPRGPPPKEVGR